MNQAVWLPCLVSLVTWSYTEGIPQSNAFFAEHSGTFNYRANERCLNVPKSSPRKVANQMMDLMKILEGDESLLINNVTSNLIRSGFTSRNMQIEPELEQSKKLTLKKEFDIFPKIAALVWLAVTDPVGVKQSGWCSIKKLNTFLSISKPVEAVNKLQALDQNISVDIRRILENFIRSIVWPTNKVKRPALELTKFYKSTKRPQSPTFTTEVITVADIDKPLIPRSIMHLEVDTEDSDEEITEIVKIPIRTPTPTGQPETFQTHPSPTTPSLRTMYVHTTAPYVYTEPTQPETKATRATLNIPTEEDESDSDAEIDPLTKSPFITKSTTVDDGFFLDEDFATRKSTLIFIEHIPVSEEPQPSSETSTTEEIVTTERTTTTQQYMPPPTTSVTKTILSANEDSKEDSSDTSAGTESKESISSIDESASRSVSSRQSADNGASGVVSVAPAQAQRRAYKDSEEDSMSIDIDAINASPTVVIAVTVTSRPFTEDDTQQFMKLVSVDEEQLGAVKDPILGYDNDNSNVNSVPVVLLTLLSNVIFLL